MNQTLTPTSANAPQGISNDLMALNAIHHLDLLTRDDSSWDQFVDAMSLHMFGVRTVTASDAPNMWGYYLPCHFGTPTLDKNGQWFRTEAHAVKACATWLRTAKLADVLPSRWTERLDTTILQTPVCSVSGIQILSTAHHTEHILQSGVMSTVEDDLMSLAVHQCQSNFYV